MSICFSVHFWSWFFSVFPRNSKPSNLSSNSSFYFRPNLMWCLSTTRPWTSLWLSSKRSRPTCPTGSRTWRSGWSGPEQIYSNMQPPPPSILCFTPSVVTQTCHLLLLLYAFIYVNICSSVVYCSLYASISDNIFILKI